MPGKAVPLLFVQGSLYPYNLHHRVILVSMCQLFFSVPHNSQQSKHLAAEVKQLVHCYGFSM